MNEYELGTMDKEIIGRCVYKNIEGSGRAGKSTALKQIFLSKLEEDGIEFEHLKGNTYEITSQTGEKYLIVISCYSEWRKQRSSFTVGKEIADQLKQERGMAHWYAVFVTISATRQLSGAARVCREDKMELSKNERSNKKGVYYALSKTKADMFWEFDEWYKTL